MTKKCTRCEETKDLSEFSPGKSRCKKCVNTLTKIKYEEKKKKLEENKDKDKECIHCKETKKFSEFPVGTNRCKLCVKNKVKFKKTEKKCTDCGVKPDKKPFVTRRNLCTDCNNIRRKNKRLEQKEQIEKNKEQEKNCLKCNEDKKVADFSAGSNICKECIKKQDNERKLKKANNIPATKTCSKCNKEKPGTEFRIEKNVCKDCNTAMTYKWRKNNPEAFQEHCKKQREKDDYREKQNAYKREAYNNNKNDRLGRTYRTMLRKYVFNKSSKDYPDYKELIGCSTNKLKRWIEFNFTQEMNWQNYNEVWNLDHIRPCSSYNLENEDEKLECFNWKNTVPVTCTKNLKKHNKIDDKLIKHYENQCGIFKINEKARDKKNKKGKKKNK